MNIFKILPKGIIFLSLIILTVLCSIIIRLILCYFKTKAVLQGEADYITEKVVKGQTIYKEISFMGKPFWETFWFLFRSNKNDLHIDDYFLSSLVGTVELFVFPILMSFAKWEVIGFWIIVKTAGSWGLWQKSRTAYNRFLLGNILSLAVSYLIFFLFYLKGENKMYQILSFVGVFVREYNQIGLSLTLIGSVFIALSVKKNRASAHTVNKKGREIYLAEISHPFAIKIGILFLIIGFLFLEDGFFFLGFSFFIL